MQSLRLTLLNTVLRRVVRRRLERTELTATQIGYSRARMDRLGTSAARSKRKQVSFSPGQLGGVPVLWCEPRANPAAAKARPTVLYFHGGGYFVGSPTAYQGLGANLALAADARVALLDYSLAPEATFPTAATEALSAYRALLEHTPGGAAQLAIGGDSAGGNLALVTLLNIAEHALPQPAGAVLLSPWTDLTASGESLQTNAATEVMLPPTRLSEAARLYAPDADLNDWRVSPLFGEFAGLGPVLMHASAHEILRDDARRVVDRAAAAGVAITYREWDRHPHVFQAFADLLPGGRESLSDIGTWLQARWLTAATSPPAQAAVQAAQGVR